MNTALPNDVPNFRQIKSFLALARHLNFTRAAEELGISQPTLTVQIHQLEKMLSVMLFDRNRRVVRMTEVGRELVQPLEQLLGDLEAIMSFSTDHAQLKSGTIRIAALPSIASSVLPKAIRLFNDENPAVAIQVHDVDAEPIMEMLKLEQVDFGVGIKLLPDKDILTSNLLTDQFCVFFPNGHALQESQQRGTDLVKCAAYPIILTERGGSIRRLVERALIDEHLEITTVQEVNHMSTALGLVRAGLGISILPYSAALNGSMDGVGCAPIISTHLQREIGIMRKASKHLSPAASNFLDTLHTVAQSHPGFGKKAETA